MEDIDREYWDRPVLKHRAWHLTVYDLQGGPLHHEAQIRLQNFAEKIAKEYNLAVESEVV